MAVSAGVKARKSPEQRAELRSWLALGISIVAFVVPSTVAILGALVWGPNVAQARADSAAVQNLRGALVDYRSQLIEFHAVLNAYSSTGRASVPSQQIASAIAALRPPASRVVVADGPVLALGQRAEPVRSCLTAVAAQGQLLSDYLGPQPSWGQADGRIEADLPRLTSTERKSEGNVDAQTDRATEVIPYLLQALETMASGGVPSTVTCPHLHVR